MFASFLSALISLPLFVLVGFGMLGVELLAAWLQEVRHDRHERLKEQRR